MTFLKLFVFVVILFLLSSIESRNISAQVISSIIHLEEKDGLGDRIVEKVTRDESGFFYFFMNGLIQKYDGEQFYNVPLSPSITSKSQSPQVIYCPNESTKIIVQENDAKKSYAIEDGKGIPFLSSKFYASLTIIPEKDEKVLISGNEKQFFFLKEIKENQYDIWSTKETALIAEDIYFSEIPTKLFYDKSSHSFYTELSNGDISSLSIKKGVTSIIGKGRLVFRGQDLLMCTSSTIVNLSENNHELVKFPESKYDCLWAKADTKGNLLVASYTNIATVKNLSLITPNNKIVDYKSIIGVVENIQDAYAEDFTQKIMLASYSGIYIIEMKKKGLETYFVKENVNRSEFGYVVSGVVNSPIDSLIYFTRETTGLYAIDNKGNVKLITDVKDFKNNNFLTISRDHRTLLSGSYNYDGTSALNVWELTKNTNKRIFVPYILNGIVELESGRFLMYGSVMKKEFLKESGKGALSIYDSKTQQLKPITLTSDIESHQIKAALRDKDLGKIWLGTTSGLLYLDQNYELIQDFSASNTILATAEIRMIKRIGKKLLVGTLNQGIFILDSVTNTVVHHITTRNGLTDNAVISAEQDSDGNMWLGTFNGISVIDSAYNLIYKLYDYQGISSSEFNTQASCKNGNRLFFGSINGLTGIEPEVILATKTEQLVAFGEVTLFKKGAMTILQQYGRNIDIPKSTDSLKIQYYFPSYYKHYSTENMDKLDVHFDSKLDFHITESYISTKKLKVGRHNLTISSKFSESHQNLTINVERNYIPLLITLLATLFLSSIWYWYRDVKNKNNQRLQEEKSIYSRKLAESQLTGLRSQMNPHFIFNALGAIQYFINTNEGQKADEYLAKFAKLIRSILESSKSKYIRLEDEIQMLQLYTSLEHIRFEEKFDYEIIIDPQLDLLEFQMPSMLIQPFVENAVNHGLYHLGEQAGKLTIEFDKVGDDHLMCTITDNGIGREASAKIPPSSKHKSRGMEIVDERIKALKISEQYDIDIAIEDISGFEKGTIIRISIERK